MGVIIFKDYWISFQKTIKKSDFLIGGVVYLKTNFKILSLPTNYTRILFIDISIINAHKLEKIVRVYG